MVVCKFFQQGNCRYGQDCRFEHVYGPKYTYHASSAKSPAPQSSTPSVTDEQLVNQVASDIQAVLLGKQWLLSRYTPFKDKAVLPGLQDLSFEEARLFIYEARATNNLDQAVAYMNNLFHEARTKHEQLLQPNSIIVKTLRSLYKGEPAISPFQNSNAFGTSNSAATSVFRSAVQNSVFGQGTTGYAQNNTSVFGQNDVAKSIFAQAAQSQNQPSQVFGGNQNVFASNQNQNVFGNQSPSVFNPTANADPAKSIFAQAAQTFTQPQNPASLFAAANQTPFAQPSPFQTNNLQSTPSIFQTQPKNVFEQSVSDDGTYSNLEDLSQEHFEAFQSDSFTLGFVPEVPPPRALCI